MNKVTWISLTIVLVVALALLSMRPVPHVPEEKCLQVSGTVENINEAGEYDVVFTLQETDTKFYINRGLENGLSMENLKNQLSGEMVLIKYPKQWTLLDPFNKINHISKLEYQGKIIYSEY